jgi:hypothetical protein
LAGRIEPGNGSGASTGHLGGSTVFGVAAARELFFAAVFEVVLFAGCRGAPPAREESDAGRCAEAVETQRSQASDAETTLAAAADQARWANRLDLICTGRGEERAERRVGIGM